MLRLLNPESLPDTDLPLLDFTYEDFLKDLEESAPGVNQTVSAITAQSSDRDFYEQSRLEATLTDVFTKACEQITQSSLTTAEKEQRLGRIGEAFVVAQTKVVFGPLYGQELSNPEMEAQEQKKLDFERSGNRIIEQATRQAIFQKLKAQGLEAADLEEQVEQLLSLSALLKAEGKPNQDYETPAQNTLKAMTLISNTPSSSAPELEKQSQAIQSLMDQADPRLVRKAELCRLMSAITQINTASFEDQAESIETVCIKLEKCIEALEEQIEQLQLSYATSMTPEKEALLKDLQELQSMHTLAKSMHKTLEAVVPLFASPVLDVKTAASHATDACKKVAKQFEASLMDGKAIRKLDLFNAVEPAMTKVSEALEKTKNPLLDPVKSCLSQLMGAALVCAGALGVLLTIKSANETLKHGHEMIASKGRDGALLKLRLANLKSMFNEQSVRAKESQSDQPKLEGGSERNQP